MRYHRLMNQQTLPSTPLGDLDLPYFLDKIWQQQAYLIRDAYPSFVPIISGEELAGLACEEEVESRIVIEDPINNKWRLLQGPFDETSFSALPKSHWSLLVQAVDWWLPEAQALLEDFNFLPRWRRDDLMISYATKGGGVGPHYDHYDVFLLQASGQRRWDIGGHYNDQSPRVENSPLLQVEDWQVEQSWTLNPGDMLYIPPGVGHNGVALDDDCMTYSIGFRAPSHAEILCGITDLASAKLSSDQRFTDIVHSDRTSAGEIDKQTINQLSELLHTLAEDKNTLAQWIGQNVTAPKYPEFLAEPVAVGHTTIEQLIEQGQLLKHTAGTRIAYYKAEVAGSLFVNETMVSISEPQQPLVTRLCESHLIDLTQVEVCEHNIKLLSELWQLGALEVED
ncbi:MAG: 50S ribosomal protein L16 3-hydroxylase [Saprospiraceae bacterium]|jgi:50S ribosomal protein L16 3-hydroxylase